MFTPNKSKTKERKTAKLLAKTRMLTHTHISKFVQPYFSVLFYFWREITTDLTRPNTTPPASCSAVDAKHLMATRLTAHVSLRFAQQAVRHGLSRFHSRHTVRNTRSWRTATSCRSSTSRGLPASLTVAAMETWPAGNENQTKRPQNEILVVSSTLQVCDFPEALSWHIEPLPMREKNLSLSPPN